MKNSIPEESISVVIPVKNEANNIQEVISKTHDVLKGYTYEIIVVDDGSVDATSDISKRNNAMVVQHPSNLGKGAAMNTGVKHAKGQVVVFIDGDGAHDPNEIPKIMKPILNDAVDLTIGSRNIRGSKVEIGPKLRKFSNFLASQVISFIVSFLLPLLTFSKVSFSNTQFTDCTSGFRAIKRGAWFKLGLISRGFEIETEMLYEAVRQNLATEEVAVDCHWDSTFSKLSIIRDGFKTLIIIIVKLVSDLMGR